MQWNISFLIMTTISLKHILPVSGTYIEKDLSINEEIEKLRLSTTSSCFLAEEML